MMRHGIQLLLTSLLIFAAPLVSAEELRMKFTFSGGDAGENIYEQKADGSFTSRTELSVAGQKISSVLTGKFKGEKLVAFEITQKVLTTEMKVVYAEGKIKATIDGKTEEREVKVEKPAFFGQYHPQTLRTLRGVVEESRPEPQKLSVLMMDSGMLIPATITVKPPRTVKRSGASIIARDYRVAVGAVEIVYPIDGEGRVLGMDVPVQKFQGTLVGWEEVFIDPISKYPELSQSTFQIKTEKGVKIRMRDGVELVADIILPDAPGKFPTILVRTPYGRATTTAQGEWWAKRGYAYVSQDCRGRHESGGEWEPFANERRDGYDTLDWVAKQPWSDGRVGMIGGSYGGYVQWAAAVERHPALKCIVPQVSPPDPFFNIPYDHGIFFLYGSVWWANLVKKKETELTLAGRPLPHPDKLTTLPLSRLDDEVLGVDIPFFNKWLERDRPSAFGSANYQADMSRIDLPALHISGWWDGDGIGTKRNWQILRAAKRANQWLIYGPWSHAFNASSRFGDTDYGAAAILELDSLYLRWFDTWLKGKEVGLKQIPPVHVFVTGANEWREFNDWPDSRSKERVLYLGEAGPANGPTSKGLLLEQPPAASEPSRYTYNPAAATVPKEYYQPRPEEATTILKLEEKDQDTLIFKTEPLKEPLEIGGPISVDLYFSTSAKDTDFFATLVDIDEKGVMRMIGLPGKIAGRFVQGWKAPKLLTPGKVYKTTIDLWDTAHRFKEGHRLGLAISSSMFPAYARNLNTGEPIKEAVRMVAAHQTVYHDKTRPSALRFRVLPTR